MHAQALAFSASVQILAISAAKIRKLGIRWLVGLYHHWAGRQGEVVSNLCALYTYVSPQMPLRTHVHLVTGKKTTLLLHSTRRDLEKWDALITRSLVISRFSGRHLRKVFSTNHIYESIPPCSRYLCGIQLQTPSWSFKRNAAASINPLDCYNQKRTWLQMPLSSPS